MPNTAIEYALVAAIVAVGLFLVLRRFFWRAPMPEANHGSPKSPGCGLSIALLILMMALAVAYAVIA